MNNECHYLVVIIILSVAKCGDHHYILPQTSLPSSDVHYSVCKQNYHSAISVSNSAVVHIELYTNMQVAIYLTLKFTYAYILLHMHVHTIHPTY